MCRHWVRFQWLGRGAADPRSHAAAATVAMLPPLPPSLVERHDARRSAATRTSAITLQLAGRSPGAWPDAALRLTHARSDAAATALVYALPSTTPALSSGGCARSTV